MRGEGRETDSHSSTRAIARARLYTKIRDAKREIWGANSVTPVEQKPALTYVDGAATLADVAQSLSTFGVSPRELASILQALRTAGALRAEVIVQ